jgi:fumarate reductase flavoprotein subunit
MRIYSKFSVLPLGLAVLATAAFAASPTFVPGTYTGEAIGRNGPIQVEVKVDKNKILSVSVLSHKESAGLSDIPLTKLPKDIVEHQTLALDSISGATFSSKGLVEATKNALQKASKDISPLLVPVTVTKAPKPKDEKVDIVVVGSGIAGLTAAINAKENGAKVLVIEKQGLLGAGDSMNISTGITAGGSKMIADKGIQGATTQDYVNLLMKQAETKHVPINKVNVETYARRGGEIIDWLMSLGVPFDRFQADKYFHITKDGSAPGPHIMRALIAKTNDLGIPYRLNSKAVEILKNGDKVVGVKIQTPNGNYNVLSKAVIMATGGFSANSDLVKRYAPEWVNRPTTGAASLTGDGILMAEKAGAAMASMEQVKANYLCHPLNSRDGVSLTAITPYTILINHDGKRFVDESHASINFKSKAMMKQPGHEAYAVVDQTAMDKLKLMRNYADAGYFVKANTVEELAEKLKVPKDEFVKTVNNYLQACKDGKDPDQNRKIQYPMGKAPYYASLVTPSMQSTYGGIKTNNKAEVLDVNGKVIPGFYAAGATSGHEAYANEVGFAAIIGLTYGKIAGENASKLVKP